jgi:hypothetical protein
MLDTYLRKLAKRTESLNLFQTIKDGFNFKLFNNEKDLSKLQDTFLSYLYFYYSLNNDIATKKVSDKVLTNEIFEDAYAYYRNNVKEDNKESNTQRQFQGVFSKDNKITFPIEDK